MGRVLNAYDRYTKKELWEKIKKQQKTYDDLKSKYTKLLRNGILRSLDRSLHLDLDYIFIRNLEFHVAKFLRIPVTYLSYKISVPKAVRLKKFCAWVLYNHYSENAVRGLQKIGYEDLGLLYGYKDHTTIRYHIEKLNNESTHSEDGDDLIQLLEYLYKHNILKKTNE